MTRVYPIFTDGKDFFHCQEKIRRTPYRFVYFTHLKKDEWEKKEKQELYNKISPRGAWKRWEKVTKNTGNKE